MRTLLFYLFFSQVVSFTFAQKKQPNIVWISFEDTGVYLPSYGDSTAQLPTINQLAKESKIFMNAFSTAGVCAPSRSAIITGMYPSTIGTNHMRTGRDITGIGSRKYRENKNVVDRENNNVREYSAVVPKEVKCFPEYLRANGYYTTNNAKTDYQFAAPFTAWDENDGKAHWRNRAEGQPFFAVFNFNETHESKIWKNKHLPLTVAKEDVPVPPYYIDNDTTRTDLARMYSNLELLDKRVAKIINQLKEDDLYDNTIIFFFSDHGGPLPRQKREVIASGLHVPFFIKYPKGVNSGKTDQLINFIDLAPTVLEMAGVEIPKHIQGQSILKTSRKYSFAARDRMDEFTSARRSVTDGKYLYVKYLFPIPSSYQDIAYRIQVPIMENLKNAYLNGELNQIQAEWFSPLQEKEQLFDLEIDPYETVNLIHHQNYSAEVKRFRKQLAKWQKQTPDLCIQPEAEMITSMWPNNQQPVTNKVKTSIHANLLTLTCSTQGASIGYQINGGKWKLYTTPIAINKASKIEVKAIRIGYKESEVVSVNLIN
ncbi:sulfatase-like hydrolase/transferase [Flammeovirga kamogawensis]|uniref:Sulfatase-like hydrolase/transferase n=1 Tax=Flammeovirga kamogawensis TaxID=373891 RepID=A0ABX8H0Q8_9BACT|nr:sulfatase-like hydrolase/transferase [Flammeovirga kamogawensis]MBB6462361.1 arylsulfatase A-like enzyme [Flammeovirga kamogawensis]QWG09475.1 sulfatase-like hydrolase/transferase [Flammeovirga kamogawensis]TRX64991.1 sulfatase-like hydrolase/transferase [Flammeovirga kamogawensis]